MLNREQAVKNLLSRNVEQVIEHGHLEKALLSGRKLRVKLGIDPTGDKIHIGFAVVLWKLHEFQNLGHKIVLIIGDFTAQIGDPSGRDKTRLPLTEKEAKNNMKNYLRQTEKIINVKKTEVHYNSEWLKKLEGKEILRLLSMLSVQQIIGRRDFKERLEKYQPIQMHELIYPILQAYDSAQVKADVEIGGSDQEFNLLVGRALMEKEGLKPQDILTVPLLVGTDGERKMSKSYGNYIALEDEPRDMFGKIMSVPDTHIYEYFKLCTILSDEEINEIYRKNYATRDLKTILAFEIVKLYHGGKKAEYARDTFDKLFSKKETAGAKLPELKIKTKKISALDLVLSSELVASKSQSRRLIQQGGLKVNNQTKNNPAEILELCGGEILKIGKKNFWRIKV